MNSTEELEELRKKLRLIEKAIEIHKYKCDRTNCENIAVCTYDSDYREHDNRKMLYTTDGTGNILDSCLPQYIHECETCSNNVYFCSVECMGRGDLCYNCMDKCSFCDKKNDLTECLCEELMCSHCITNGLCPECNNYKMSSSEEDKCIFCDQKNGILCGTNQSCIDQSALLF